MTALDVSEALYRIRAMQRLHGCANDACRSRDAEVYWGDGCSDCHPETLGLEDTVGAPRLDAAIDNLKEQR